MVDLGEYDGRRITKVRCKITNAGDGLSQAMNLDPQIIHWGDRVYVLLECEPGPVTHKPIPKTDDECEKIHSLIAGVATTMRREVVGKAIELQTAKIIEAREKEKGIQQITEPGMLATQHVTDGHKRKVKGCPDCYPPKPAEKKPRGATTGATKPTKAKGTTKKRALQSVK